MVFHHILMLYFFIIDFKVYTAYYTLGEILSIWSLFSDDDEIIRFMRLLSIFPVRFLNLFLSTIYFIYHNQTRLTQYEINNLCVLLTIMLPVDAWWFYSIYKMKPVMKPGQREIEFKIDFN